MSHQLYADPERHFEVRAAGIAYMRDNPERFSESNTEISWLEYLNNMSMQGSWGDAIIIQAVADQLKLKITTVVGCYAKTSRKRRLALSAE